MATSGSSKRACPLSSTPWPRALVRVCCHVLRVVTCRLALGCVLPMMQVRPSPSEVDVHYCARSAADVEEDAIVAWTRGEGSSQNLSRFTLRQQLRRRDADGGAIQLRPPVPAPVVAMSPYDTRP